MRRLTDDPTLIDGFLADGADRAAPWRTSGRGQKTCGFLGR